MIYLIGDSHIDHYFANLDLPHVNCHQSDVTMHRIGRDNTLINFKDKYSSPNSTFVILYGEIDCRCHIYKQVLIGRNYKDICDLLVANYFTTISNMIKCYKSIVICSIPPPVRLEDYSLKNNSANDTFPILGSDSERITYVTYMNSCIEQLCKKYGYTYLYINDYYKRDDGSFNYDLSDRSVHVSKQCNKYIIDLFKASINS
jgi:hypothetical protein